ncbi:hypothetical protein N8500_10190 [Candidatus Puniceispirillum sp.]|nr:hypothetical protein [Candidatus Puniceispirillum sp.]
MSKGNSHKKKRQLSKDQIGRLCSLTMDKLTTQSLADFRNRRLKDNEKHPSILNTINTSIDSRASKS